MGIRLARASATLGLLKEGERTPSPEGRDLSRTAIPTHQDHTHHLHFHLYHLRLSLSSTLMP
jgi:hypothetical protein